LLKYFFFVFFCFSTFHAQLAISFLAQEGFIIPHTRDVEFVRYSRPQGFSLSLVRPASSSAYLLCRCYPRHVFSYMWFDYNNVVLGSGHHWFYGLESGFKLARNIFFTFSGNAGLHYGSRPYHPLHNPENSSYSFYLNGYLGVSAGIDWHHPSWAFNLRIIYHHISNGGIKEPNKGINWPVVSLGYSLRFSEKNTLHEESDSVNYVSFFCDKKIMFMTALYYSSRIISKGDKKRWGIYGLTWSAVRKTSLLHAWWGEGDIHLDKAVEEIARRNFRNESPVFVSVAAGHGFILGKFFFTQGAGIYLIRPAFLYPLWYHRWGLQYHFSDRFFVEIRLKAHLHIAHFLDARVGWKWNIKKNQ